MSILERFRIPGRVAVITGAGRGIGAAIARAYAEAGADVAIAARTASQLDETAAAVRAQGRRALCVPCDVSREDQIAQLVERALAEFGRLDIAVNNVGGWMPKPALETSMKEFEMAFHFNVGTAFALTRLAVPEIVRTAGSGCIVNISSVAGRQISAGFAAYGTAKAALSFLTQQLAQDFAPKVRVNAIAVGATRTSALAGVLTPELEKEMVASTPMGRIGEVEDIAACALYLASPAASYVTGEVFGVSGGITGSNLRVAKPAL
jgi:7-alpha-hydroxysteroid dehydrogenase